MTTGTEGNDNLTNDQSVVNETIDALGGDDIITIHRPTSPSSAETIQVNGGAGFDTLIINDLNIPGGSATGYDGHIRVREGNGVNYDVFWTSIERLEVTGKFFASSFVMGDEIDIIRMSDGVGGGTISTGGGNDEVYVSGNNEGQRITVDGGTGDDILDMTGLNSGANPPPGHTASGGDGNDVIRGSLYMDRLDGGAGDDVLTGNGAANGFFGDGDQFTGGAGNDTITGASVDSSTDWVRYDLETGGGAVRVNLSSGPATLGGIDMAAGTARDTFGNTDTLTSIERVSGGAAGDFFAGRTGNDRIDGGAGADNFYMYQGGNDNILGSAGNDNFFFGATLTADDIVTGGADYDTLVVQGNYPGGLTLSANVTGIEAFSILAGSNTNFGESGAGRYDYTITTNDANFAAGVQARVNGSALLPGEDFTFNGSAETDGSFVVYGGKGVDTLLGGLGNDIFFYPEERFASGDTVNGGPGYDGMFLRGNYTIDFNAPGYTGLFTNIENLTLTSATDERYARGGGTEFDYNLTLSNAIVGAGQTLTVSGTLLMASETMILDASQESDGILNIFGGAAADTLKGGGQADLIFGGRGADMLTGNGGADVFRYDSIAESDSGALDRILDFTPGTDKIDLTRIDANSNAAGDQAFTWIGSTAFSHTAGELRAENLNGMGWFLEGDTNGDGAADFVVMLTLQGPTPLGAGDFLL